MVLSKQGEEVWVFPPTPGWRTDGAGYYFPSTIAVQKEEGNEMVLRPKPFSPSLGHTPDLPDLLTPLSAVSRWASSTS